MLRLVAEKERDPPPDIRRSHVSGQVLLLDVFRLIKGCGAGLAKGEQEWSENE